MKNSNKFLILFFTFILISFTSKYAYGQGEVPKVSADSMVLMDATTGQVLLEKNMNNSYPPASTTKIMTALLTLENCNLKDKVTVGEKPPYLDGSKIGIKVGEIVTVEDLLYGLMLQSGNDCALALAEHISGSSEAFAELMNKRAKELGCKNTHFVNPHGLYDENHKASAYDLALILKELYKHSDYRKIASTAEYKMPPTNKTVEVRNLWNKNKLITGSNNYGYKYCTSGKTGYTRQSQYSFVATAEKDNLKLIVTLVHDSAKNYWTNSKELFEYGFNNYELIKLYTTGEKITDYKITSENIIPLLANEDFYYVKSKNSNETAKYEIPMKDLTDTSFNIGDNILDANITYEGQIIGKLNLIAGSSYSAPSEKSVIKIFNSNSNLSIWIKIPIYFSIFLLALLIIRTINIKRRKKRRLEKIKNYYKYKKRT